MKMNFNRVMQFLAWLLEVARVLKEIFTNSKKTKS